MKKMKYMSFGLAQKKTLKGIFALKSHCKESMANILSKIKVYFRRPIIQLSPRAHNALQVTLSPPSPSKSATESSAKSVEEIDTLFHPLVHIVTSRATLHLSSSAAIFYFLI